MPEHIKHDYAAIVQEALTEPGKISAAYSSFWNYSLGNQWLAMMQLGKAEPINTYPGWLKLQRQVKKGAKAISLLMPVLAKAKEDERGDDEGKRLIFISRKNWFGLSATEGEEYIPPPIPDFDIRRAAAALNITVEPFEHTDGNCQGYAKTDKRIIAVSPLAYDSLKTSAHEIGHVLLHAGLSSAHSSMDMPKDVREVEAELVAYLLKSALGQTKGLEYSRGYIQHYLADGTKEKVRYGAVFHAVDDILKAGRIVPEVEPAPDRPAMRNVTEAARLTA